MQMRQRDVAALDAKYTKELADAKAENDALRDDVAAGRRRLHIKAVCQSVREATPPPAWILASDWRTPLNRIISPSEADLLKNNWKEPRSILMSSADRVAHIDGQLNNHRQQYTRFQEYNAVLKPSNPFTDICARVSVLTTFFCAATNFGYIDGFLLPNSRNEEMMGDGFLWCCCCRFVLNSKRLLSTSCNKQGQRSSE